MTGPDLHQPAFEDITEQPAKDPSTAGQRVGSGHVTARYEGGTEGSGEEAGAASLTVRAGSEEGRGAGQPAEVGEEKDEEAAGGGKGVGGGREVIEGGNGTGGWQEAEVHRRNLKECASNAEQAGEGSVAVGEGGGEGRELSPNFSDIPESCSRLGGCAGICCGGCFAPDIFKMMASMLIVCLQHPILIKPLHNLPFLSMQAPPYSCNYVLQLPFREVAGSQTDAHASGFF
jgi:hypothetical protein